MFTPRDHLHKAAENKRFAESIKLQNPTEVGWALTVLFYSALHYVSAYEAKYNTTFSRHQDRDQEISRNPMLSRIYNDYKDLYDYSLNARYKMRRYCAADFQKAKPSLDAVENHIKTLVP